MKNIVYIVLKYDISNSDIPVISVYNSINKSKKYIINEIDNYLNYNINDNLMNQEEINTWKLIQLDKYKAFLDKYDLLYYYGEYKHFYDVLEDYQIKFKIEKHEIL